MDWTGLKILSKAPKKKYIKKIIQYAAALLNYNKASDPSFHTPISTQISQDLQLSSEDTHRLIISTCQLIDFARQLGFDYYKMNSQIGKHLQEELTSILSEILMKISTDITKICNDFVRQGSKLIDFDWKVGMQVANQKGKCNTSFVQLQLTTSSECQCKYTNLLLKGEEFKIFFKNLQKIKINLAQLTNSKQ